MYWLRSSAVNPTVGDGGFWPGNEGDPCGDFDDGSSGGGDPGMFG